MAAFDLDNLELSSGSEASFNHGLESDDESLGDYDVSNAVSRVPAKRGPPTRTPPPPTSNLNSNRPNVSHSSTNKNKDNRNLWKETTKNASVPRTIPSQMVPERKESPRNAVVNEEHFKADSRKNTQSGDVIRPLPQKKPVVASKGTPEMRKSGGGLARTPPPVVPAQGSRGIARTPPKPRPSPPKPRETEPEVMEEEIVNTPRSGRGLARTPPPAQRSRGIARTPPKPRPSPPKPREPEPEAVEEEIVNTPRSGRGLARTPPPVVAVQGSRGIARTPPKPRETEPEVMEEEIVEIVKKSPIPITTTNDLRGIAKNFKDSDENLIDSRNDEEVAKLEAEITEKDDLMAKLNEENDNLASELKTAVENREEMLVLMAQYKEQHEETEKKYKEILAEAEGRHTETNRQNEQLKLQLEQMKEWGKEQQRVAESHHFQLIQVLTQAEERVKNKDTEIAELKSRYDIAIVELEGTRKYVGRLTEKARELEYHKAHLEKDIVERNMATVQLESRIRSLDEQVDQYRRQMLEAQRAQKGAERRLERLQDQMHQANLELTDYQSRVKQLSVQNDILREDMQASNQERLEAVQNVTYLEAALSRADRNLDKTVSFNRTVPKPDIEPYEPPKIPSPPSQQIESATERSGPWSSTSPPRATRAPVANEPVRNSSGSGPPWAIDSEPDSHWSASGGSGGTQNRPSIKIHGDGTGKRSDAQHTSPITGMPLGTAGRPSEHTRESRRANLDTRQDKTSVPFATSSDVSDTATLEKDLMEASRERDMLNSELQHVHGNTVRARRKRADLEEQVEVTEKKVNEMKLRLRQIKKTQR